MAYTNPSSVSPINPQFGTSSQFNIPSTQTPYPYEQDIAQNQDYINRLSKFIPLQRGQTEEKLGLPLMRENYLRGGEILNNLQSRILALPQNVADSSRNSLMNEGQRANVVNAQEAPMQKQMGILQGNQTNLGNTLNLYEGIASKWQEQGLLPWEKEFTVIDRQQAAQLSGWTEANKNELNRLISNQNAGYNWTSGEATRANELAKAELEYKAELEKQKMVSAAEVKKSVLTGLFS